MRKFIDVSQLKIEKNIPLPTIQPKPPTISKFIKSMKVGDSVMLKGVSANYTYTLGWAYLGKGNSAVRKVSGGYRLWRVK